MTTFQDLRAALADQGAVASALLAEVTDWSADTRLPGWSVRVLVGHMGSGLEALWRWQAEPGDGAATFDDVSYWDGAAAVAEPSSDWAIAYAARRSDDQIRDDFLAAITRADQVAATTEPDAWIAPPMGNAGVRFEHFLATRLLEITVHGLDLSAAIGSSLPPAPSASMTVAALLDRRLGGERPPDLDDDLRWIEAATGRTTHPDDRLPVLA